MVRSILRCATFSALLLGFGLTLTQPCHGRSVGFEETGSMAQPRAYHTATLLPDGKVLVTAGADGNGSLFNRNNSLASSTLYDPATRTWAESGSLTNRRYLHTATLLPNGKVLVVGGTLDLNSDLASAELYDPATGTWTPT
ncbi:MAG TPA: kelch repeat-containing protein, partial [Chthoniobacterales bacterium]